jgi:hypothetical protein
MKKLDISLLICAHIDTNSTQLGNSFNSIQDQIHIPNEIIIIHNGPLTDKCLKLIKISQLKYKNFTSIFLEHNIGLAKALNEGIKFSNNNLIARLDPGDIVIDDRFYHQKIFMDRNKNIAICGSFINEIYKKNKRIIQKPILNKDILESLKFKNPIIHSTVIFRKKLIEKIGSYPIIDRCQDYFLWVKCSEFELNFHNLPLPLVELELDFEMMKRRNFSYFLSELKIYRYMFKKNIINLFNYIFCIIFRFFLRIMPDFLKIKLYNFR